jgi:hypothetical protein
MKRQRPKTEDQELIQGLLGRTKFLMLNIELVKSLGPNAACYLTYLLDKAEYLLKSEQISSLDDGFYVFRRDITRSINLNSYYQRKVEEILSELEILRVVEMRHNGETWNQYYLNIVSIFELIENNKKEEINTLFVGKEGVESLYPPPINFAG